MKRWYNRKPETMQDWLLLFAVAAALLAAVCAIPPSIVSKSPEQAPRAFHITKHNKCYEKGGFYHESQKHRT